MPLDPKFGTHAEKKINKFKNKHKNKTQGKTRIAKTDSRVVDNKINQNGQAIFSKHFSYLTELVKSDQFMFIKDLKKKCNESVIIK